MGKNHYYPITIFGLLVASLQVGFVVSPDPRGTPLDELLKIKDSLCKNVSVTEFRDVRVAWSQCIDEFILRPNWELDESEELRQYYLYFCRDKDKFKGCWENVTVLLNKCEAGRGDISRNVYFAIYNLTCKNVGNDTASKIMKSVENGELCELKYVNKICNETRKDWYSLDICRRYTAQEACERSAISKCSNDVHKQMLLDNLEEIGRVLDCMDNLDSDVSSEVEETSSSSSSISQNNVFPSFIVTALYIFICKFILAN